MTITGKSCSASFFIKFACSRKMFWAPDNLGEEPRSERSRTSKCYMRMSIDPRSLAIITAKDERVDDYRCQRIKHRPCSTQGELRYLSWNRADAPHTNLGTPSAWNIVLMSGSRAPERRYWHAC
jgi:hypothetical protein